MSLIAMSCARGALEWLLTCIAFNAGAEPPFRRDAHGGSSNDSSSNPLLRDIDQQARRDLGVNYNPAGVDTAQDVRAQVSRSWDQSRAGSTSNDDDDDSSGRRDIGPIGAAGAASSAGAGASFAMQASNDPSLGSAAVERIDLHGPAQSSRSGGEEAAAAKDSAVHTWDQSGGVQRHDF